MKLLLIFLIYLVVAIRKTEQCSNDRDSRCKSNDSRHLNSMSGPSIISDICQSTIFGICIPGDSENVYIQAGFCLTHLNSTENFVVGGLCPYFATDVKWSRFTPPLQIYYAFPAKLPLAEVTNYTCGPYNREGLLCSKCKPGYGPAVYAFSLQCVKCTDSSQGNWILYFFLVLFPISMFYFIVVIFNIRATAPPFTGFILMCQTYCMIETVMVPYKMKLSGFKNLTVLLQVVRMLCGFWNLDFFRFLVPPFCLSSNLNNLQALSLEYVHAIFPLFLIIVTAVCIELHARNFILLTIIWKPFHNCVARLRRSWDPTASVVNAFSMFLLLNFSKVTTVTVYYVYGIHFWYKSGFRSTLYSDPSVIQYSKQHIPYIIFSCCYLVPFALLPTLLLCLYPTKCFRRLLRICLCLRLQNALFVFIDTFQGHYKDGTNETRDYRSASGLHIVVLALMIFVNLNGHVRYSAVDVMYSLLFAVALFYALARPCKQNCANILQSILIATTAVVMMLIGQIRFHNHTFGLLLVALLCLLAPHLVLGGYVVYKITKSVGINHCDCDFTENCHSPWHKLCYNDSEHTPLLNNN